MKKRLLGLGFAAALAFPSAAGAGVTIVSRDLPLFGRALQSAAAPIRFNMVGLQWQGAGTVSFRVHGPRGWSAWRAARPEDEDLPSRGSGENRLRGWRLGNPYWVGVADGIRWRTRGAVHRLRAHYLWSAVDDAPVRRVSIANSPLVVARAGWQADEKIKRGKPLYAPVLKAAIVHHTAGTNTYSRAQAAAIVRGIEIYHVKGNGWNDIGYNFLVDRYGTVYEGRFGGVDRNVTGAHAEGFNSGTTGVALIGNYSGGQPTAAQRAALVQLLAWRLDVAHVDPRSTVAFSSAGNAKFRAGRVVTLRAVSGHRDTGWTTCPGAVVAALLPSLAQQVQSTGLPKLYAPTVSGALGGPIRFQARLSGTRTWTVTVSDTRGAVVATGTGRGRLVDWTWGSARAGKGPFRWSIDAGAATRPATGTFGKLAPPSPPPPTNATLTRLAVAPGVVGLPPDGTGTASVSFTLGTPARVTASVLGFDGGIPVPVLDEQRPAGANTFTIVAAGLADGRYTLLVTATPAAGAPASAQAALVVSRTLYGLAASTLALSPNGDAIQDTMAVSFVLTQAVPVRVEVRRAGAVVASLFTGQLQPRSHVVDWNGTLNGARPADGAYELVVNVTDPRLGEVPFTLPFVVDTTPPTLTVVDGPRLRLQVSEAGTVTALVNGQTIDVLVPVPGLVTVPFAGTPTALSARARDAAGNVSAIVSYP